MSGFGLDPNIGRVTADALAWEEFLKGKPEFEKWKNKHCPRYDELEVIFGNDVATGERSTAGNDDISPIHVDESVNEIDSQSEATNSSKKSDSKRSAKGGTNRSRRKRTQPDESVLCLWLAGNFIMYGFAGIIGVLVPSALCMVLLKLQVYYVYGGFTGVYLTDFLLNVENYSNDGLLSMLFD
ncbi:uncharacterized protein LOC127808574 [Diospyros lotus]|uniref:uncharacterized protein LOC127808574 n=1 Tax=Diospyros lotus TaxID=55363 RepID=UPI002258A012|nr:uncharacterized protein LOC127808574 [Diospyros lotus]